MNPYGNNYTNKKKEKKQLANKQKEEQRLEDEKQQKAHRQKDNPYHKERSSKPKEETTKKSPPPKLTIRDFFPKTISNNYQNNKDAKDLRKKLNPILVLITENTEISYEPALLVLNKVYESLPREYKEEYIGKHKLLKDQVAVLESKLTSAVEEAMDFIKSTRNMLLHTPKNEEDVFKNFRFDKVNGDLFTLFKLSLRMEMIALEKHILTDAKKLSDEDVFISEVRPLAFKDQIFKLSELVQTLHFSNDKKERYDKQLDYWKNVATHIEGLNKKNKKDIPYIYAFASIALFADIKDVQELLTVLKMRSSTNKWILQYCIKGSYKIITNGIFKEDESLELHRIQLKKEPELRQQCLHTNKHLKRDYNSFLEKGSLKPNAPDKNIGYYYQKLLRYYGFSHSFPALPQYEEQIRRRKAERLCKVRKAKYKNIKEIRDDPNYKGVKPELPKYDMNVETVKDSFTYIYRTDDVFMHEVMGFLSDLDNIWFEQNWQIRDNTVLWQNPYDKILFDIRRKTKPSKNALSSIYPMIYSTDSGEDVTSLGRNNLRYLVIAVLLKGDKSIDFEQLHATAKSDIKSKTSNPQDSHQYWENLSKECHKWKRYEQAFLVVKFIRKYISQHIHLQKSIAFHQRLMNSLYIWDAENSNLSTALQSVFITEEGLSIPKEIEALYHAKNLKELCKLVCLQFADVPKKASKGQTHILLKTWKSHAFSPTKKIDQTIKSALKWNDDIQGDSFDIMLEYFDKNNYAYPDIVDIYLEDKTRQTLFELLQTKDKKLIKEERKTRDILAEELLLMCIAFHYIMRIEGESSYLKLESTQKDSSKKQSPTAFNIVWDIEPKLTISLEDYNKKNVKQIVSWIFDPRRINRKLQNNSELDKDLAKTCYESFNSSAMKIKEHEILGAKTPKESKRFEGSESTLKLENKFKAITWFQKEMISHICEIESSLIYILEKHGYLKQIDSKQYSYYNFSMLVNLYSEKYPQIENTSKHFKDNYNGIVNRIKEVRRMLAHGKLIGGKYDINTIVNTIEEFREIIGKKSLYDYYYPKRERSY